MVNCTKKFGFMQKFNLLAKNVTHLEPTVTDHSHNNRKMISIVLVQHEISLPVTRNVTQIPDTFA